MDSLWLLIIGICERDEHTDTYGKGLSRRTLNGRISLPTFAGGADGLKGHRENESLKKNAGDRQDDGKSADKADAKLGPLIRAPKRLADSTLGIVMKGYDDQNN